MGRLSTAVFVIFVSALAACSDGDIQPDATPPPPDRDEGCDGATCNTACIPFAPGGMQGCDPGEKCVWEFVQTEPERIGRLACVPDGTVALGAACTTATVGQPDNCQAGLVCVSGTCHEVCGFNGSAEAGCPTNFQCTRYQDLYANGDDPNIAGACNPSCDPITQLLGDGSTCGAGNGCYMLVDDVTTIAVCAGAGDYEHNETVPPADLAANACVPGAQLRQANDAGSAFECGGLCRPPATGITSTMNMAQEGGVAPDTCQGRWGANPPSDGVAGESCRFWWANEQFDGLSPFSNTVGFCWKHAIITVDHNQDGTPDFPFPRCVDLTEGDVVEPIGNPPHNDARFFWCLPLETEFAGGGHPKKSMMGTGSRRPRLDRLRM
jgi:hypothetical protein